MKRMVALVFVIIMVFSTMNCLAETITLANLNNDELINLLIQVQTEIANRNISKSGRLPSGSYIVGQDIPAGKYIFTCLATGEDWGNVTVKAEGGRGERRLWEVVSAPKESKERDSFFVTLFEGDELKSGVPFSLTVYSGMLFE